MEFLHMYQDMWVLFPLTCCFCIVWHVVTSAGEGCGRVWYENMAWQLQGDRKEVDRLCKMPQKPLGAGQDSVFQIQDTLCRWGGAIQVAFRRFGASNIRSMYGHLFRSPSSQGPWKSKCSCRSKAAADPYARYAGKACEQRSSGSCEQSSYITALSKDPETCEVCLERKWSIKGLYSLYLEF